MWALLPPPSVVHFLPASCHFGGIRAHWAYTIRYFSPISKLVKAAAGEAGWYFSPSHDSEPCCSRKLA